MPSSFRQEIQNDAVYIGRPNHSVMAKKEGGETQFF